MFKLDNEFQKYLESILGKEKEPEYNLTIQDVMKKENVGKHFSQEIDKNSILWLTEDENGYLKLLIVKDPVLKDEYLYDEVGETYYLEFIVHTKYKEVQFKC